MTERCSPTRTELSLTKSQIALAMQGRDLLKQKRNVLMKEFMQVAEDVLDRSDELEQSAAVARRSLTLAEALDGEEAVRSASFTARGEVSIGIRDGDVTGVPVPQVEQKNFSRSLLDRGYSLHGTSAKIDDVARYFEEELNLIVKVAASEVRLRYLVKEIQRASRRVNALENITLPRLTAQRDYIQMVLEEREREDHFRLKRVKRRLQEKRARSAVRIGVASSGKDQQPPAWPG